MHLESNFVVQLNLRTFILHLYTLFKALKLKYTGICPAKNNKRGRLRSLFLHAIFKKLDFQWSLLLQFLWNLKWEDAKRKKNSCWIDRYIIHWDNIYFLYNYDYTKKTGRGAEFLSGATEYQQYRSQMFFLFHASASAPIWWFYWLS